MIVTRLPLVVLAVLGLGAARAPADPGSAPVFADFASRAGAEGVREVRLWVDGQDVTGRADVTPLRVSYDPSGKLAAGEHAARVVVVDSLGRSFEKAWTFTVAEEPAPELVAFFSRELLVDLDALPARVREGSVRVSGFTQPDAEVELRIDGRRIERIRALVSGRFEARLALEPGQNDIEVQASRPETAEEGEAARARVELVGDDLPGGEDVDGGRPEASPRQVPDGPASERGTPGLHGWVPVEQPPPRGDVVITKPSEGDEIQADHVTVLGRAPAGWVVVVSVNAHAEGDDVANPAGHFTVPRVPLAEGRNELVAEARSPDGQATLRSQTVVVTHGGEAPVEPPAVALSYPARGSSIARGATTRLEGVAWDGAAIEVEVNGRLVTTDVAGLGGRFRLDVPLEAGPNTVIVEAFDLDSGRSARAPLLQVLRVGASPRGGGPVRIDPALPRAPRDARLPPPAATGVLGR